VVGLLFVTAVVFGGSILAYLAKQLLRRRRIASLAA
jgi:hypothetical protein